MNGHLGRVVGGKNPNDSLSSFFHGLAYLEKPFSMVGGDGSYVKDTQEEEETQGFECVHEIESDFQPWMVLGFCKVSWVQNI